MLRDRSYHDLSSDEKKAYDELRRQQRAATTREGKKALKEQADAMLGMRAEPHIPRGGPGRDREVDHQSRNAGTSRDFGHQ